MTSDPMVMTHAQRGVREPEQRRRPTGKTPSELLTSYVDNARQHLAEARERLKAARRRVVELESAVAEWEALRREMRAAEDVGRTQSVGASRVTVSGLETAQCVSLPSGCDRAQRDAGEVEALWCYEGLEHARDLR